MNWEQRVEKYFDSKGYRLLGFEAGLVFFEDRDGKRWGARESAIAERMEKD